MFRYHNVNPKGRRVNDCTVRAISLATGKSWDETFQELSSFARSQAIMPDEVEYIDEYLDRHFDKVCDCKGKEFTIGDFARLNRKGVYLLTMSGHITCCIDGCIYDTFNPSDRYIWDIYRVK